jgi:hypothetical protein
MAAEAPMSSTCSFLLCTYRVSSCMHNFLNVRIVIVHKCDTECIRHVLRFSSRGPLINLQKEIAKFCESV